MLIFCAKNTQMCHKISVKMRILVTQLVNLGANIAQIIEITK